MPTSLKKKNETTLSTKWQQSSVSEFSNNGQNYNNELPVLIMTPVFFTSPLSGPPPSTPTLQLVLIEESEPNKQIPGPTVHITFSHRVSFS